MKPMDPSDKGSMASSWWSPPDSRILLAYTVLRALHNGLNTVSLGNWHHPSNYLRSYRPLWTHRLIPASLEIKGAWIMVNISSVFTGISMYWK